MIRSGTPRITVVYACASKRSQRLRDSLADAPATPSSAAMSSEPSVTDSVSVAPASRLAPYPCSMAGGARVASAAVVDVEVEVLLLDRLVGAVGADVLDCLVEPGLQLRVALAHHDTHANT